MKKLKISSGWVLALGLILTLLIFLSTLVVTSIKMDTLRMDIINNSNDHNRKSELIATMYKAARERVLSLYRMLDTEDDFDRDDIFIEFNNKGGVFASARADLLEMNLDPYEKHLLEEQGQLAGIVAPQLLNLTSLIQNGQLSEAREILNVHSINVQTKLLDKLERLLDHLQIKSDESVKMTDQKFSQSKQLMYYWAIFAFFTGLLIAFLVIKSIRSIENKLFLQIENTKATLSSIGDSVVTILEDGTITYMNRKANELLGAPSKGLIIWDCIRFLKEEYKLSFTQMLQMSDKKDAVELGQFEISSHGKHHWIDIFRSPVYDKNDQLIGIVLVLHDVTRIKETELALFKSNETLERRVEERTRDIKSTNIKLEESILDLKNAQNQLVQTEKMAALGGLVAGISHEINTPIGTSVTSATSIEETFLEIESQYNADELTQDNFTHFINHTREGLEILNKNLMRASELIRSFKQIAVDQTSSEWREINIREYTNEIITSLSPHLKKTNIIVECNIPDDLFIYTSPGSISQVFSNLILNSVIHGFSIHGVSDMENRAPAKIIIEGKSRNDSLCFHYIDNGRGMDADILDKVFDPFFTTRRGQGGSGLGMNIVFNIITTQLKGNIFADSAPGKGVFIEMNIPFLQKQESRNAQLQ